MSHVTSHVSCVTCHVPHVMCKVSCVVCHMSCLACFFVVVFCCFFGQSGEAYWWRVCYERGLPRLVQKGSAFCNGFFTIIGKRRNTLYTVLVPLHFVVCLWLTDVTFKTYITKVMIDLCNIFFVNKKFKKKLKITKISKNIQSFFYFYFYIKLK